MRALLIVLLALLLVLVQAAVLQLLPVRAPAPALGLLVALHVGASPRFSASAAVLVSFATGYLLDLSSGAPRGAHALVFMIITLLAAFLGRRLSLAGILQKAAAGFGVSLLGAALLLAVRRLVASDGPAVGFAGLAQAPLEALVTALAAPALLHLLERIDGQVEPRPGRNRHRGLPLG
jgi:rod shape-determining protein MreD